MQWSGTCAKLSERMFTSGVWVTVIRMIRVLNLMDLYPLCKNILSLTNQSIVSAEKSAVSRRNRNGSVAECGRPTAPCNTPGHFSTASSRTPPSLEYLRHDIPIVQQESWRATEVEPVP